MTAKCHGRPNSMGQSSLHPPQEALTAPESPSPATLAQLHTLPCTPRPLPACSLPYQLTITIFFILPLWLRPAWPGPLQCSCWPCQVSFPRPFMTFFKLLMVLSKSCAASVEGFRALQERIIHSFISFNLLINSFKV